jgi:hypothetical protein
MENRMKKYLIVIALLLSSTSAFAASAFWTGRQEQVQTVTNQWAWNCEYNYNGQIFWRIFKMSCPSSVEVE